MLWLGIAVMFYGLFRYRKRRNLFWWLSLFAALLIAAIGVYFLGLAIVYR